MGYLSFIQNAMGVWRKLLQYLTKRRYTFNAFSLSLYYIEKGKSNMNLTMPKKQKSTNTFTPLDYYLIRTPTLPLDYFNKIINRLKEEDIDEWVRTVINDSVIREAIFVSSPSLFMSLDEWDSITKQKRKTQIAHALNNYLIRMSTRPTPFGLFAGVSIGKFSESSSSKINHIDKGKKLCKPDMRWLFSLIKKLEKDPLVLKELQVKFNDMVETNGNRLILSYKSNGGIYKNFKEIENTSIRKTKPVEMIQLIAKKQVRVRTLIEYLHKEFPQTPKESIIAFIGELVEQDYLITDIRPSLLSSSPFKLLIQKLKKIELNEEWNSVLEKLVEIKRDIDSYEQILIGEGLTDAIKINNKMKQIVDHEPTLHIDLKINNKELIKLNYNVAKELNEATDILMELSKFNSSFQHLERYKNEFIEKYGEYREVPLLELLNEDLGLGAPANYNNPVGKREFVNGKANKILEDFLLSKLMSSIKENSIEITITKEEIDVLKNNVNLKENEFIDSVEVFGQIVADKKEDIDDGKFKIILAADSSISNGIGKTFGRFKDLLIAEDGYLKEMENHYKTLLREDTITAEMTYTPNDAKIGNIMHTGNFFEYELSINGNISSNEKKQIYISDILVGIDNNTFYLKCKRNNKRLEVHVNSLINKNITPNIFRFIFEVSLFNRKFLNGFSWGELENKSEFFPRVRCEKVVLSPAKWNFNLLYLGLNNRISYKDWEDNFIKWCKKWNVPQIVYYLEQDNKILLDLKCKLHMNILYSKIKKVNNLTFIEKENMTFKSWMQDDDGASYVAEFVFPMKRKISCEKDKSRDLIPKKSLSSQNSLVRKQIGGEWLYLKLYHNIFRDEELISKYIPDFCDDLLRQEIITKYFYVRYQDNKPHIRLRIKGKPSKLYSLLPTLFSAWFKDLLNDGIINNVEISTYEREVERYGGPDYIDKVENLFYFDSKCVSNILNLKYQYSNHFNEDMIAILSVIDYLDSTGMSLSNQIDWIEKRSLRNEYYKEFRKQKKNIIFYTNPNNNWENLKSAKTGEILHGFLTERRKIVKQFSDELNEKTTLFYNNINDIWASIIHLHLNRLIGIDREKELRIMSLVKYTLLNFKYAKGF